MTLDGTISSIEEEVSAFGWREGLQDCADALPSGLDGSFLGLAQVVIQL